MEPLYTPSQSRAIDKILIDTIPLTGYQLMQRAARACFSALIKRWPQAAEVVVFVGTGNNGGDGYLLARLLHQAKRQVSVFELGDSHALRGDAARARAAYLAEGGAPPITYRPDCFNSRYNAELIIDAIFGSGLNRDLPELAQHCITAINRHPAAVLAVDIPSGLNAHSGCTQPLAVEADLTVTFIVRKRGLYTAAGRDCCGEIVFDNLQISKQQFAHSFACAEQSDNPFRSDVWLTSYDVVKDFLPDRPHNTHKKQFGHVLVVGGNVGMAGAVRLTGEAALRSGAGLVSVATRPPQALALTASCPTLMVHDVADTAAIQKLIQAADVIAVGPGLGQDKWAMTMLDTVLNSSQPLVVDADALNLLAKDKQVSERWILTPHPGEAARLLGTDSATVQADRFSAAKQIQSRYGGVCVLKGAGTIVYTDIEEQTWVCEGGNAAMSSAGTGDVLCGIIAALLGQGLYAEDAVLLGVCMHARVGDVVAVMNSHSLLATDLIKYLPVVQSSMKDV